MSLFLTVRVAVTVPTVLKTASSPMPGAGVLTRVALFDGDFAKSNALASCSVRTSAGLTPARPPGSAHRQILPVALPAPTLTPRAALTSACVSSEQGSVGTATAARGRSGTSARYVAAMRMADREVGMAYSCKKGSLYSKTPDRSRSNPALQATREQGHRPGRASRYAPRCLQAP